MLRSVALLSWIAVTTSKRLFFIRTTSADSKATSVPAPMAIPTSDRAKAGASLMPSPTIATVFPCVCRFLITSPLSSGKTSAIAVSIPSSRRTASAVRLLSPVSITTSIPSCLRAEMASLLVGLATSATAIIPITWPFAAKNMGVLPSSARRSASVPKLRRSMSFSCIKAKLPA